MCNFKSAIVIKDPKAKGGFELFLSPWTESHSDLMLMRGIKDGARINCARVEFSPPDLSTADKPETYRLLLDEERSPEWWNGEMADAVASKMRAYIKNIIISGDATFLIGGQFILGAGAKVECVKNAIINVMLGSSQVGEMWCGSQVGKMLDSSRVGVMWCSSQVSEMLGSSQVGKMLGGSQVGEMLGSSRVGKMLGGSQVGKMLGSSRVGEMWGSSRVGEMLGGSQVGKMLGSSKAPKTPIK